MVTGGTGIVGSALKEYVEKVGASKTRKWIFLSSMDGDLRNLDETEELFRHHKPKRVVHLAVKLMAGGDMVVFRFYFIFSEFLICFIGYIWCFASE